MIRKAGPQESIAIAQFLEAHIDTSMFLLGNLERHGVGNTTAPYGTHYFLRETGDGITGVFGCTNNGLLMCQLPRLTRTEAQTYAHLLRGYTLRGMTGAADQAGLILDALPVPAEAWQTRRDEPLMRLSLDQLEEPDAVLRAAQAGDLALLSDWCAQLMAETRLEGEPPADRAARMIAGQDTVLLLDATGQPVAMTAINARAGQAVQVGSVFVPPALRGQGLAGRVVAAHLAQLRGQGMTTAILFAASDTAARAYARIGFRHIGAYRVAMLAEPVTLGTAA